MQRSANGREQDKFKATLSMKSLFRSLLGQRSANNASTSENDAAFLQVEDAIQQGNRLEDSGDWPRALELYQHAVTLAPSFARAHLNLGNVLRALGQTDEALKCYLRAAELDPDHAGTQLNLGTILLTRQNYTDAASHYRQAIQIRPDWADAWAGLAGALEGTMASQEAVTAGQRALALDPGNVPAACNLAVLLRRIGQAGAALKVIETALKSNPDDISLLRTQASLNGGIGEYNAAIATYRRVLELAPDDFATYSDMLWTLNFVPDIGTETILAEHKKFGEKVRANPEIAQSYSDITVTKKLKIGYVSPDFRRHPVSCFIEPLLQHHNRELIEVHCFYDYSERDNVTQRLSGAADKWHDIAGLDDQEVVRQIVASQIDILVDLTGHTSNNRLRVFAHKPAPVQFSWLGYLCTTGVESVDYRLCDFHTDPENVAELWQVEKPARLPDSQWCYQPQADVPACTRLPMLDNGYCTFGSFNQEAKLNLMVLQAWSHLLAAIPDSRLRFVGISCDWVEKRIRDCFSSRGIASERLEIIGRVPIESYFASYGEVDIALDSFPYTGATTTCDSLIMGVPVATVAGQRSISRSGVSLLTTVGLHDWIAPSADALVKILQGHIADPQRLAALRGKLRERIRASALMDGPRFARNVEALYKLAWGRRCANQKATSIEMRN